MISNIAYLLMLAVVNAMAFIVILVVAFCVMYDLYYVVSFKRIIVVFIRMNDASLNLIEQHLMNKMEEE